MDFEIIFYRSKKTAAMQQEAENLMMPLNSELSEAVSVSEPDELAAQLLRALKHSRLVIITGDISGSASSAENILSRILSPSGQNKKIVKKTISENDHTISCLVSGKQMILLLPDSPEECGYIKDEAVKFISGHFDISAKPVQENDMNKVSNDIEGDISITKRTPILPQGSTAEKRNKSRLDLLKTIIIALIVLGVLELAAALILYFIKIG